MLPSVADIDIDQAQGGSSMERLFEQGEDCNKFTHCYDKCIGFLPPTLLQKVVAEITSTYFLVFFTCGSSMLSQKNENLVSKLGSAMASGLIVTVMIYSVGHISGAHMNPAVTLSFATVGHFSWKQRGELAGIAVGCTVTITAIFAGPISGGSMNPARSLGPAVASNKYIHIWIYVIGPFVGTIMGGWSYTFIRLTKTPLPASSSRHISSFPNRKDPNKKCVLSDEAQNI